MILGPELLHTPASLSPRPSPSPHPTCAWQRPTSPARVTQTTLRAVPKDAACLEQPEHRVSLGRLPGPHGDRAARRGGCQERNCRPAPLPSWSHECLEVTYTWGGGSLLSQGLRAPTPSPTTSPSPAAFPPKRGGLAISRRGSGQRTSLQPPCKLSLAAVKPNQGLGHAGGWGWGALGPWPLPQATMALFTTTEVP